MSKRVLRSSNGRRCEYPYRVATQATLWLSVAVLSAVASACGESGSQVNAGAGTGTDVGATAGFSTNSAASTGSGGKAGAVASTGATSLGLGGSTSSGASGGSATANSAKGGAGAAGKAGGGATGKAGAGAAGQDSTTNPSGAAGTGGGTATLGDTQTLIPHASWTCGMPEGIPSPKGGKLVAEVNFTVSEIHDIGETQYGYRHQIDITGGTVQGPNISAEVLTYGLDYQLKLSNGAVEVEQLNMLRTDDGALIYFRNCGTSPDSASDVRVVPDFEAPSSGKYAFLNTSKIVGIRALDMAKKTLKVTLYEVAAGATATDSVKVNNPAGVPDQTWDCKTSNATQGAEVYREVANIGSSLAVGASKRGTRNVIPITGGSATGRVAGTIIPGGADFQIIGTSFEIDARYTLKAENGELVIIRNCGAVGGLVPVFEANKTGKYAWLNENNWLSSDPGIGIGSVTLTIYEAN
jgi:hypothetical protein